MLLKNDNELLYDISAKSGFRSKECIHEGKYYSPDKIRNVVYSGKFEGKPAVLKIYDDPRMRRDGPAQSAFNEVNQSKILIAPEVYKYEAISLYRGWVMMEALPIEEGYFLKSPLEREERSNFLKLYMEYRKNSPWNPHRPLQLIENEKLPADFFHLHRINRWMELANKAEAERVFKGEKQILDLKEFIPRYQKAMDYIRNEFRENPSKEWCVHSSVRPQKVFKVKGRERYYLLDFCRAGMRPKGYELAVIIWSDWLMATDYAIDYQDFENGVEEWIEIMADIYSEFMTDRDRFAEMIKRNLVERILGTILTDICANKGMPDEEKRMKVNLMYQLLDSLFGRVFVFGNIKDNAREIKREESY